MPIQLAPRLSVSPIYLSVVVVLFILHFYHVINICKYLFEALSYYMEKSTKVGEKTGALMP